tara:strand:- start:909 stop:2081 length:1173 start_codon:yes stop_codon:yes gene_type:complete
MEKLLVIRKSRALLILFFFINFYKIHSQNSDISFSVNGYVKYLPSYIDYNLKPSTWIPASLLESQSTHLIHNRLNMRGYFGNNLTLGIELRNRIMFGDLQPIQSDPGWIDMSFYVLDKPKLIFHSMVDRLWIKYQKNKLEINIGRQRVNWGVNTIWNSNDLFNAYNFIDFDYIERPGSDVVRIIYTGDNLSSIEFVFMPTSKGRNVFAGMYRFNKLGYDFQIIGADYYEDIVIGGGWAGNILKAGFKGEMSYFINKYLDNSFSLSSSVDYSFKSGYYLLLSYLYNSQGRNSPGLMNFINLTDNELSARNLMPSKNSYLLQISKPISPPVNASLTAMYGAGINLVYLSPSISFDVNSRIDLNLIGQVFFLENTQKLENLMRGVYVQMKYSF